MNETIPILIGVASWRNMWRHTRKLQRDAGTQQSQLLRWSKPLPGMERCGKETQCLVPFSGNKGYSRNQNFNCHICNTTSSSTFLHMFWECPVVISLWTHVNLVLSSLLRIDWSVNPSLCLLNDDSDLCISSMQKRMLFAGFTAVKKTIIQNWFTPHMCREAYWIRSLLQIVSCECTTARVGGARPSTIEAWQSFLLNIRNYLKEWLLCSCCPSLSPSLLIEPWDVEYVSAVLFCFILDILLCCVWKNKK